MATMLPEAISEQKRLVRGLHWKRTQFYLRARDHVHHKAWEVLIIAGPLPHEEINCIREYMPHAHITAVDICEANVLAAIDAGADEAHHLDISKLDEIPKEHPWQSITYAAPLPLQEVRFDVICLDLTGPANDWLKRVAKFYFQDLAAQGVMILTMSYGRDVVEAISAEWSVAVNTKRKQERVGCYTWIDPLLQMQNIPEELAARIWYVMRSQCNCLDSCLQYRGNQMPMLSCLFVKKSSGLKSGRARFLKISDADYVNAIVAEDVGAVFACPVDRILELRQRSSRRAAALKAHETRRLRNAKQPQLRLIEDKSEGYKHDDSCECPECRLKRIEQPTSLSAALRAARDRKNDEDRNIASDGNEQQN